MHTTAAATTTITRTVEIGVDAAFRIVDVGAGAEVDQLNLIAEDEQIFVLDVPVNDAPRVTRHDRLEQLAEEVSGEAFLEKAALGDEVEEVFAGLGSLQDEDVGVVSLVKVQQPHHAWDRGHFTQETNL